MKVTISLFLLMAALTFLLLGAFLETVPMYYLPNPVMAPIAYTLEIQLTQLYVLSAAFVGVALITPPVCVGAYTAAATAMVKPQEVIRHLFPYIFVVLIFCGLVYIFVPVIATWLPSFL